MSQQTAWVSLGKVAALQAELGEGGVKALVVHGQKLALSYANDQFGLVHGSCNHVGGPLGHGKLEGDYIVCPWHYWKFHRLTGEGEPGYEADRVPCFDMKEEGGELLVNLKAKTSRNRLPHPAHPLTREVKRAAGKIRVVGISTTMMDPKHPRYSTSEALMVDALKHAEQEYDVETKIIKLAELNFRNCEGFYSKSAHACTWPCSITQMDPKDQMEQVYDALVHWADVVLLATPIRWGAASALYYRMAERLNCVQNQITLKNNVLIQNKVASFIITGGQDNVQAVAGQTLGFFAELGFHFPPFPYVAHSLGWSAENMERNVSYVAQSQELRDGSLQLLKRAIDLATNLIKTHPQAWQIAKGGRKARRIEPELLTAAYPADKKNE